MEADASTLDMPSDCCYFVEKAAAAGAAPAFQYFDSIFHHFAVVTQNLGQTRVPKTAKTAQTLRSYINELLTTIMAVRSFCVNRL